MLHCTGRAMLLDRFKLEGKVALVTGSGRGIGRGIAQGFAELGADLVVTARSADQIQACADAITALGRRAVAVRCDVNERWQLEALMARALEEFGRVDILVNNAGGADHRAALRTSEHMFEETLRFNLTSAFLLTRMVAGHMLEGRGGVVLNISSTLGLLPERGFVAYGTAKAALAYMSRVLGHELAPRVRVNALAVGLVETPATAPMLADAALRARAIERTPLRRLGRVEDVAAAAAFLCSDAGAWVTGKVFEIDGGTVRSNFPIETPDL